MKHLYILFTALAISLLISCSEDSSDPASSDSGLNKYTVSGIVIDSTKNQLISGISVVASEYTSVDTIFDSHTTQSDGAFSLELEGGSNYVISASRGGYGDTYIIDELNSDISNIELYVFLPEPHTISGKVVGLEGEPLENIELSLSVKDYKFDNLDQRSVISNSSGNYEFVLDYGQKYTWEIELINNKYRFQSDYVTHREFNYTLIEDIEINFTQIGDLVNNWVAVGDGIADTNYTIRSNYSFYDEFSIDSIKFAIDIDKIKATEFSDFASGQVDYMTANYTVTRSDAGDIHEISFPEYAADTLQHNFKGIYRIEKTSPKWTLTLEFVDLLQDNTSAPTVSGGFGSANGGANGDDYVWTFKSR